MNDLLEQHAASVYRFALHVAGGDADMAADLAQETMLRAWRHRRTLRHATNPRTWLFRITANLWRDELRKRSVRRQWRQSAGGAAAGAGDPPVEPALRRESAEAALEALHQLPTRQREVLYLSVCEDLSIAQIAEALEITPAAARSSLSLARQQLRRRLEPSRKES